MTEEKDVEGMSAFHETELTAGVALRRRTRWRGRSICGGGRS